MGEAARLSIPALDQAWISMFAGVERNSMKNKRALLMMALAIVFGLAAVALASRWLLRQTPGASNKIVVAAQDVNLGQRLTPEMLQIDWPAETLPRGACAMAASW
jgi:Flp pilus assembly protein CpaB